MSTAKWQIIAGSKKFFSLGRICYSALKWRRDFRQVQKHSNRVISYIVCHLILHILNRASELTVGTAEAQQWVTSVTKKMEDFSNLLSLVTLFFLKKSTRIGFQVNVVKNHC